MARSDLDYLARKYKIDEEFQKLLKDKDYHGILTKVFETNARELRQIAGEKNIRDWSRVASRSRRPLVIPKPSDLLENRAEAFNSAFEKASSVTDTLRKRLIDSLQATVVESERGGARAFLKRKVGPKLERQMAEQMEEVFSNYTKRKPRARVPEHIRTIAVTEVRGAIARAKADTATMIREDNPDAKMTKKWIHNRNLSKNPKDIRHGHELMNGKTIPFDKQFKVPSYKTVGGRKILTGYDLMEHPHDPDAPADQVIGCHCDCEYNVS